MYFRDMNQLLPDDESGDKIVLEAMLHTIQDISSAVFNECHLENSTSKLVQGNIDLIVGNESNGDNQELLYYTACQGFFIFSY